MLKTRLLYAALLIGMLFFHSYYTGWISWFLLIFLLCLPVFSLLFSLPCVLRQRFSARLPERCTVGETALLHLVNTQRSVFPALPCIVRLSCADRMGGTTQTQEYRFAAWDARDLVLTTAHCGTYIYSFSRGRMTDYLGLFSFPMHLPELGALRVWPNPEKPEPLPNLSRFQARAYRPKHGGGFSEIHDLREYRPGDSLRDIHWKLSAKTDKLVVREAQEPDRRNVLLTLDLCGDRARNDRVLGILLWVSRWLLEHEAAHFVCWLSPEELEPVTMPVSDEAELALLMDALLDTSLRKDMPSIAGRSFAAADWRYHIRIPEEVPV